MIAWAPRDSVAIHDVAGSTLPLAQPQRRWAESGQAQPSQPISFSPIFLIKLPVTSAKDFEIP
jgi:hypothetical protein